LAVRVVMSKLLYWLVYHLDLGRLGPKVLDLAVQSWLKRAHDQRAPAPIRRRFTGLLTVLHLEPKLRADQSM
jgi:hypothetical protein